MGCAPCMELEVPEIHISENCGMGDGSEGRFGFGAVALSVLLC